jgi:hypothetical protein
MKTALNTLHLVYPPISNQEGEWPKKDSEVEEMLRRSDLYMIGAWPWCLAFGHLGEHVD